MSSSDRQEREAALQSVIHPDWPETWAELVETVFAALLAHKVFAPAVPAAAALAASVLAAMVETYGGAPMYITRGVSFKTLQKARAIASKFDGKNHRELAREFNVSEMRVRQLLEQACADRKRPRQTEPHSTQLQRAATK